jgi:hypothetical protein
VFVVVVLRVFRPATPDTLAEAVKLLTLIAVRVSVGAQNNRTDSFGDSTQTFHANTVIVTRTTQGPLTSVSVIIHCEIVDLKILSCKV